MIWLALLALAAVAMVPLALSLYRQGPARGRRQAAMDLHRAQLAEIDRDLAAGRLGFAEHKEAKIEIQRRLLAAADTADAAPTRSSRKPLVAMLVLVPLAGLALYLPGGSPFLPAAPYAARLAAARAAMQQEQALINMLQQHLASLDPHSRKAREGYLLLGNAQRSMGNLPAAAAAWRKALAVRFDPTLAAETAEAETRAAGRVTAAAAALFRKALAEAPPNAPWRALAQHRLGEAPPASQGN